MPSAPTLTDVPMVRAVTGFAAGFARNGEFARPRDMNFDLIAAFEFERLHHGGGKPNGQTVAPFGDLHVSLR